MSLATMRLLSTSACRLSQRKFTVEGFTAQRRFYMKPNRNVLSLHDRGIFQNVFPEESTSDLLHALQSKTQCFYCGFDPTADSLHIGNLLTIMALLHCHRANHNVIALIGGATSAIGDPSGKSSERSSLPAEEIEHNTACIRENITRIIENHKIYFNKTDDQPPDPIILNNSSWYKDVNIIDFLSTIGRKFRMGTLLGRHSVESRLASSEGMSLTEFTYQIFQAYDWLHLYSEYGCLVQIGGNDQIGNIVSGHDLISKVTRKTVFGLTVPLITSTEGAKLGKTAGNAVWLDKTKTSVFQFYQYWIRLPDADVEKYLKLFTFYSTAKITKIMESHQKNPQNRGAQKHLASEVCRLIHGESGLEAAQKVSAVLYEQSTDTLVSLTADDIDELGRNLDTKNLTLDPGTTVLDLVAKVGDYPSKALHLAVRKIEEGGIFLNNQRCTNPNAVLIMGQHVLPNNITLLRLGKKNYYLVRWK